MSAALSNRQLNIPVKVMQYLIALVIILDGASMWTSVPGVYSKFVDSLYGVLIAATIICLISCKVWIGNSHNTRGLLVVSAVLMYLFVFILINFNNTWYFVRYAAAIFVIGLYYCLCDSNDKVSGMLTAFRNIMLVIAAASTIMWLLFSILRVMAPTGTIWTAWIIPGEDVEINSYFGIYFEPQTIPFLGREMIRNCAMFCEAPMASFSFTVAALVELFISKKTSVVRTLILAIAIFTTFSTTGILIVLAAVVARIFISILLPKLVKATSKGFRVALIIIILAIIVVAAAVGIYLLRDKLLSGSGSIRIDDYKAGFRAWMDHKIIGNGMNNMEAIIRHMAPWRGPNYGFSNSIMQILSDGGILLGILFLGPYIRCIIHDFRKRNWLHLVFTVCIFVMFCITVKTYSFLSYFFIFYFGLTDSNAFVKK